MSGDYRMFVNRDLPPIEKACASKAVFVSRSEARRSANGGRASTGRLKPYHCHYYDHWHLGHPK